MLIVSLLAAPVGLAAGVAAWGLYALIGLISNLVFYQRWAIRLPGLQGHLLGLLVVVVPAAGGAIVGLMARYGSRAIRGHGIPEAMEAVLLHRSRIAPRVAVLKPLSAAVAIGTGGPFGAEGPIIQTGGALGSLLGQLIHTTAPERKTLLACGAAAGMAATFGTPIAAVILALELLLFEFKPRSFIPLVIAGSLATSVRFALMGRGPMFAVGPMDFDRPAALPFYVILGLLCGLAAVVFTRALYGVEDLFGRLPIGDTWWPAIGGLGLGFIGLCVPRVLGVGYDTISDILDQRLALSMLLAILLFKSLALLVSLGSGTSGGLLAPMFMTGAALGGAFARIVDALFPVAGLHPGAFALLGMAAMFGAAARAPFALIVFAFELTRNYDSILALMLTCIVAHAVALALMRDSIMTEKLARRGLRVHQEFEVDVDRQVRVEEVMDRDPAPIPASMSLAELSDRIARADPEVVRHQALPLLDEAGRLCGLVTRGDLMRAWRRGGDTARAVREVGCRRLLVAYPDETLHEALNRMLRHDIGRLPVVARDDPGRLVGYLGRGQVLQARRRRIEEEERLERGWLGVESAATGSSPRGRHGGPGGKAIF
ncbi:MAG TPA: chloride channel protein [Candidatus Polarisedimenticolia bacterium]|nr:chloride channel protein [Candidatus Polarisedimenticolia bacterium]